MNPYDCFRVCVQVLGFRAWVLTKSSCHAPAYKTLSNFLLYKLLMLSWFKMISAVTQGAMDSSVLFCLFDRVEICAQSMLRFRWW